MAWEHPTHCDLKWPTKATGTAIKRYILIQKTTIIITIIIIIELIQNPARFRCRINAEKWPIMCRHSSSSHVSSLPSVPVGTFFVGKAYPQFFDSQLPIGGRTAAEGFLLISAFDSIIIAPNVQWLRVSFRAECKFDNNCRDLFSPIKPPSFCGLDSLRRKMLQNFTFGIISVCLQRHRLDLFFFVTHLLTGNWLSFRANKMT